MALNIILAVLGVSFVIPYAYAASIVCNPDDTVTFTGDATDAGFWAGVTTGSCESSPQQLDASLETTFVCTLGIDLGVQFGILVTDLDGIALTTLKFYPSTCFALSTTIPLTEDVTFSNIPPLSDLTDDVDVDVEMIVSSTQLVALGDPLTVTIVQTPSYYVTGLTALNAIFAEDSYNLVNLGCPSLSPIAVSISRDAQDDIVVNFDAFILYPDQGTVTMTLQAVVDLCTVDAPSLCEINSGCIRRRKRREDADTRKVTLRKDVVVFSTKAERDAFTSGVASASTSQDSSDVCLNKVSSVVILVFLIAAMVLCLLMTICMFAKYRKSRRLISKEDMKTPRTSSTFTNVAYKK